MLRSFLTLALSMFLLAEASAQTTPAAIKKTTKTAKAAARVAARNAKKAKRVALKTTPPANDGWTDSWPTDNTQTAVASTTGVTDAAASTSRGEIDNANVYAAPGQPVHIRTSNGLVPYSVRPARKPAADQTTLGN